MDSALAYRLAPGKVCLPIAGPANFLTTTLQPADVQTRRIPPENKNTHAAPRHFVVAKSHRETGDRMNSTCTEASVEGEHREGGIVRRTVGARARRFFSDADGAALIEYGLLVLLLAALCIVVLQSIGSKVSNGFNSANAAIP
jgi:Flp pilus assembly pilin Flp